MSESIEDRVARLEGLVERLGAENLRLRRQTKSEEDVSRRGLLKGAAAVAAGAAGLSLFSAQPAEAGVGTLQYGSTGNDAGPDLTSLASSNSVGTFAASNSGLPSQGNPLYATALSGFSQFGSAIYGETTNPDTSGHALYGRAGGYGHSVFGEKTDVMEHGHPVLGMNNSAASFYAAVAGVTVGPGPGIYGRGEGTGNGLLGEIDSTSARQSAVRGTTAGPGAAVEGYAPAGRGGVFDGKKAQVQLKPSKATNRPSNGQRGDLFVDASGRLWYCRSGGTNATWVQLA